jgi:O-antigen ligase
MVKVESSPAALVAHSEHSVRTRRNIHRNPSGSILAVYLHKQTNNGSAHVVKCGAWCMVSERGKLVATAVVVVVVVAVVVATAVVMVMVVVVAVVVMVVVVMVMVMVVAAVAVAVVVVTVMMWLPARASMCVRLACMSHRSTVKHAH